MLSTIRIKACSMLSLMCWSLFPAVSAAGEPEIAQLKQAIPVLSPENEALSSFYLIGESIIPLGVPVTFEACWTRERGFGFVQNDQFGYPIFFIAEKKLLLYDATQSQIFLGDKSYPQALISNKERKMTWNVGFGEKEKSRFFIDVASLVTSAEKEPELSRVNDTDWKLTYRFERQTEIEYVFRVDQEEISFQSVLFRGGDQILFTVRNVTLNQRVPEHLMKFPDIKALPTDFKVQQSSIKPDTDLGEALTEVSEGAFSMGRAFYGTAAMENVKFRNPLLFSNINWEQVKQNHKRLGPKLKAFLKVEIKDPVILPPQE